MPRVRVLGLLLLALGLAGCPLDFAGWRQGASCANAGCPPGQECAAEGLCLARCRADGSCAPDEWNEGASFSCGSDGLCHFDCTGAGATCPADTTCDAATGQCRNPSQVEILATDQDQPTAITVDTAHVYWANGAGGAGGAGVVRKVPLGGGTVVTLASGFDYPAGLVVDDTHAYWVNLYGHSVVRVPKGGGDPVAVAGGLTMPLAVAIDADFVYFAASDNSGGYDVARVPKAGGEPVVLASVGEQPRDLAVAAGGVYVLVDTGNSTGALRRIPLTGGAPVDLAGLSGVPLGITLADDHVYGLSIDDRYELTTLWRVPFAGGAPATVAAGSHDFVEHQRPALDATHAYVGRRVPGGGGLSASVVKVPRDGGAEVTLVTQIESLGGGMAVDASYVYFSAARYPYGTAIMRTRK